MNREIRRKAIIFGASKLISSSLKGCGMIATQIDMGFGDPMRWR